MLQPALDETRTGSGRPRPAQVAYAVAVAALVVPRLHSGSPLWLDEALSVNIASLSYPDLLAALRVDGSPPLYYLLLHVWMSVFGTGDDAVRWLSTLCSLAALPMAHVVGLRLGGPRAARAAVLLLAASPFAVRYATETRMYSLVVLLALVATWLALRALDSPTPARLAAVSVVSGALVLAHYWTLFLLAAGVLVLLAQARREGWRSPAARVALSVPVGGVLFLPWLPSFLFQSAHTGTPWGAPPTVTDGLGTLVRWSGPGPVGHVLAAAVLLLAAVSLRAPAGRRLVAVGLGGLALGLVVFRLQGSSYALRYSAPLLVPVLLAAALGAASLGTRVRAVALGTVVALSLGVLTTSSLLDDRTQAASTAAVIGAEIAPGDVVVYCPDQLGPAVDRLLPTGVRQVAYPTMAGPDRIDWTDYAARNAAGSPADFARALDATTSGRVWLVRADGYLTYGDQCAELDDRLTALRGGREVRQERGTLQDGGTLVEYPAR